MSFEKFWEENRERFSRISSRSVAFYLRQNIRCLDARIAHYDISVDPARQQYNEHCIHVFWHEYILMAVGCWAKTPVTMLVSQHPDADWLVRSADHLGFHCVRGSTSRGGSKAIRQLKRNSKFSSIGITPDGPRGPRRQMAMGPIFLASILRMPIVPVGFGYQNPWRAKTWDRFAIPKPFSRARAVMGPKITVPPRLERDKMEVYRKQIERLTTNLTTVAENWAREGGNFTGSVSAKIDRKLSMIEFSKKTRNRSKRAA